ncbi:MAG: hypothetical protein KKF42_08860 [Actinobacteria bacterium]|nr:hypothetical protein [Actinomycetota bacterium]
MFWQTWNVAGMGFTQNDIFFARVEIKYSGVTYSSGLTFMMRLAATPEEIGEIINVQSTFTFMQTTTNFSVYSWLEKSGVILGSASNCTVRISESGVGVDIYTDTALSPANGVFSQNWNATGLGYDERDVFFGRTEIEYGGTKYTSGQTFMMRLAASDAITNMMADVENTRTNVDSVKLDTGYIRGVVDGLTGSIEGMSNRLDGAISTARGDIMDAVGTNTLRLGQALTGIENVSNKLVNVIEPNVTNIMNEVRDIYTNTMSDTSRILTRPSTVQNGSTVTFLYKTRPSQPAANVRISVSPGGYNATMTEILAGMGIYERDVTFSWGPGTYIVTCSDPGGRDSMVIESVDATADDAPGMIAGVSNVLDDVMSQVTNISALVANIGGINTTDIMTGLDGIEQKLTTLRSDVSGISEIKSAVNSLDLSSLKQIDVLAGQVGKIGTDASDAAQSANLAKLDAKKAATGIQDLKDALDAGNAEESLKAIAEVKKAIISSQENLKALTGLIDMGGLGSKMNNMLEALKKLAEKEGFEGLIDSTEKLVGDGTQVEGMDGLNKNLNEMTGKMIHMQKLLDEAAYEPVITETLLGE